MVYLPGPGLPRLCWKKRQLNGCSGSSSTSSLPCKQKNYACIPVFVEVTDIEFVFAIFKNLSVV